MPRSVPQFPFLIADDFHVPHDFMDNSFRHDLNPSIFYPPTERVLYWDTEGCDNLRAEGAKDPFRFTVFDGGGDTLLETNDLQAALRCARGLS